jgi:hypothetical protein
MSDLGANDTRYRTTTHLGHLLKAGDVVQGYLLATVGAAAAAAAAAVHGCLLAGWVTCRSDLRGATSLRVPRRYTLPLTASRDLRAETRAIVFCLVVSPPQHRRA